MEIQVTLPFLSKPINLNLTPNDTINQVKQIIEKEHDVPQFQQLIFLAPEEKSEAVWDLETKISFLVKRNEKEKL